MEQVYAQALWKIISQGESPKRAIDRLCELLEARARLELLPKIARAFKRIAERESRKDRIVLSVAHGKDEHWVPRKFKGLFNQVGIDTKDIETRIDNSLVGGWRLEGREMLLDASYKRYLLEMYNNVVEK